MGMHLETHIGAYIEIEAAPTISEKITMVCGKHPGNTYPQTASFCDICGKELTKIVTDIEKETTYWDLLEEGKYEDELACLNAEDNGPTMLLGSNSSSIDKPDKLDIDYGEVEIAPEIPAQYVQNFKQNYEEIINLLTPRVKTLEVKFGIIIYYA